MSMSMSMSISMDGSSNLWVKAGFFQKTNLDVNPIERDDPIIFFIVIKLSPYRQIDPVICQIKN
jgi:hypothetical protein